MMDQAQIDITRCVTAEQSVIGGILLDNNAYDSVADMLTEADFASRDHRMLYRAITKLLEGNKPADIVTVAELLDTQKALEEVGGMAYIGQLMQNTPSAANIKHYATMVRDYSILRNIGIAAAEVSSRVKNRGELQARDILDFAQSRMMSISEMIAKKSGTTLQSASQVMDGVLEHIDYMMLNGNGSGITGLPTGLTDLDKMTTGFQPGELIIIAARPAMGKTSLALNMVEHMALNERKNIAVFSLEMVNNQLGVRLLSSVARINQQRVKVGRFYDDELDSLHKAANRLRDSGIYLDEESNISITELRARARRLHRECGGLHMIVIDYLQLMEQEGNGENEAIALAKISRALKLLAKELHIPVIALSQLNRGLEQRPDKRPKMSDLRGSGGIEQDADMILFIYRDEVYNEDTLDKGIAEIIIGKQRNGAIGTVHCAWIGHLTRFENLAQGTVIPSQEARQERKEARFGGGNFRAKNGYANQDNYVEM